jgi:hypothetical protein
VSRPAHASTSRQTLRHCDQKQTENRNALNAFGENFKEGLLDEGSVNTDIDDTNLIAVFGQGIGDLRCQRCLDSAKDNENTFGFLVAVVIEQLVILAKLIVEGLEQADNAPSMVRMLLVHNTAW